jgi:DNA-binding GntR family transcriptional regulator
MRKERSSLADQVYHDIKYLILSGELQGGNRIPEEKLAEQFGVSRTPVREAVRRLDEFGLVRLKPRSYAEVISLSEKEADQVMAVRTELEALAVSQLAENASGQDVQALTELAEKCYRALEDGSVADTFELDSCFHLEIAQRSGNGILAELMERLDAKVQLVRLMRCSTPETINQNIHVHDKIIAAIAEHDGVQAEAIMREHIHPKGNE